MNEAPLRIEISPDSQTVITEQIQRAIDSCAATGGGTVVFPAGNYRTGGLHLRSNVTLQLEKGATLQGSNRLEDYGAWKWTNALIISLSERPETDFTSMTFEGRTTAVPAFFNATSFDVLTLNDVTIITNSADPAVIAQDGNRLVLKSVKYLPSDNKFSLLSEDIGEVVKN